MKNILALFTILFILNGCSSHEPDYVPPVARMGDFESDESGFNTKTLFYDNGHEVVVFDTQLTPELAEKAIEYIRSHTEHPIRFAVITQPSPDKFNGMSVFQKAGAKIIISSATAASLGEVHRYKKNHFTKTTKAFTTENYPALGKADVVFNDKYTLKLSHGETIDLRELSKSGASANQTVAYVPRIESLVVGDLISYKSHAWLEGGIYQGMAVAKLKNWISVLKEISSLYQEKDPVVYGSRGKSAKLNEAIEAQEAYLLKVDEIVTEYVKDLAERGRKKKDLNDPEVAAKHYGNLKNKIEAAFPGYKNAYLVEYGIYGLVNSKL